MVWQGYVLAATPAAKLAGIKVGFNEQPWDQSTLVAYCACNNWAFNSTKSPAVVLKIFL